MSDDRTTPISITGLHEAIKTTLRAAFPTNGTNAVQLVDCYTRFDKKLTAVPAILFELTSIDPQSEGDDIGTEQLYVTLSFSAHICVSYRETAAKIAVRELVSAVMWEIWDNRWGLKGIQGAENVSAQEEQFSVEPGGTGNGAMQQYETWRIDWTQDGLIGMNAWNTSPETIPSAVFLGIAPLVGPEHIDDYMQVIPKEDGE